MEEGNEEMGIFLMFVPRHPSQGHPKSNFTWLEWTDVQHSWSSWRSGGKTQTKHRKTLGKCPVIPFFPPLCVRRGGKKKAHLFCPESPKSK